MIYSPAEFLTLKVLPAHGWDVSGEQGQRWGL